MSKIEEMKTTVKLLSEEELARLSDLYSPVSHNEVLRLVAIARWAARAFLLVEAIAEEGCIMTGGPPTWTNDANCCDSCLAHALLAELPPPTPTKEK